MLCPDSGKADPSVNRDAALDAKIEQRSDTVVAIEDFDAFGRKCKCDRRTETTCRRNASFVPGSALPTRFGIPTDRCPNILGLIADNVVNAILRYWVKQTFVEKKILPVPTEFRKYAQREGVHDSMPFSAAQAILDSCEWPSTTLDERRKEALADFGRQLLEHGSGAINCGHGSGAEENGHNE